MDFGGLLAQLHFLCNYINIFQDKKVKLIQGARCEKKWERKENMLNQQFVLHEKEFKK